MLEKQKDLSLPELGVTAGPWTQGVLEGPSKFSSFPGGRVGRRPTIQSGHVPAPGLCSWSMSRRQKL